MLARHLRQLWRSKRQLYEAASDQQLNNAVKLFTASYAKTPVAERKFKNVDDPDKLLAHFDDFLAKGRLERAMAAHERYLQVGGAPNKIMTEKLLYKLATSGYYQDSHNLYTYITKTFKSKKQPQLLQLASYTVLLHALAKTHLPPLPKETVTTAWSLFNEARQGYSNQLAKTSRTSRKKAETLYGALMNVLSKAGDVDGCMTCYKAMKAGNVYIEDAIYTMIFKSIAVAAESTINNYYNSLDTTTTTTTTTTTPLVLNNKAREYTDATTTHRRAALPRPVASQLSNYADVALDFMHNTIIPTYTTSNSNTGTTAGFNNNNNTKNNKKKNVFQNASIWNGLLLALASSRASIDEVYAQWSKMVESGVVPDVYTERHLAKAFQDYPTLAADILTEARILQNNAAARDAAANAVSGGSGGGEKNSSNGSTTTTTATFPNTTFDSSYANERHAIGIQHHHQQPADSRQKPINLTDPLSNIDISNPYYLGHFGAAYYSYKQDVKNADLLFLDLHGHSVPAARAAVMQRLMVLVQTKKFIPPPTQDEFTAWLADDSIGGNTTTTSITSISEKQQQQQERQDDDNSNTKQHPRLPPKGLILVCGIGNKTTPRVLAPAITHLLSQYNLPTLPMQNPGRLLVPYDALYAFISRENESIQRGRLMGIVAGRYMWLGAGAVSVGMAVHLIMKLSPWL